MLRACFRRAQHSLARSTTIVQPLPCEGRGNHKLCIESTDAWRVHSIGAVQDQAPKQHNHDNGQEWAAAIQDLVKQDTQKPPSERIDSVVWQVESASEPTPEMWRALDGLSPKHLSILAGYEEEFTFEGLKTLKRPWTELETLTLRDNIKASVIDNAPDYFSRISALTLEWCCSQNLVPPGATRLKELRIIENNACDMFAYAVDNPQNPNLAGQLEVLDIQTTNGCDMTHGYEPQDFRNRLQKCTRLRELYYAACISDGLDVNVAAYIPSSVETVGLRFTRSLPFLRSFEDWFSHAADSSWLPHLKRFKMAVDPESALRDLESEDGIVVVPENYSAKRFDQEFEEKKSKLYELLRRNKPSLALL